MLIFALSNVSYKGLINAIPVDSVARAAAKNLHAFFQFSSSLVSFCSEYRDRRHLMNKCIFMFSCMCCFFAFVLHVQNLTTKIKKV